MDVVIGDALGLFFTFDKIGLLLVRGVGNIQWQCWQIDWSQRRRRVQCVDVLLGQLVQFWQLSV